MRRLLTAALATLLALACATPAAADDGYVDLALKVQLDKAAYLPTDQVRMTVTIQNLGTAMASGVVIRSTGDLEFGPWGELDESGPGAFMKPSAEPWSFTVFATPNDTGDGMTQQVSISSAEPDRNPADNAGSVSAFVTGQHADLSLRLHADGDGDGVVDPGETLSGVAIELTNDFVGRTDAQGVARFPDVPSGQYYVSAKLPAGWYLDSNGPVEVRPGHNEAVVRAWHVEISKLAAAMSLDRPSYAVGDTVRLRVTLTNTDDVAMPNVTAQCARVTIDMTPQNDLVSDGWGELAPDAGVTLRAGETRTWEFTDVVTQKMWEYGFVVARCQFLLPSMVTGTYAEARAAVPGGRGTLGGALIYQDAPVAAVKLLLLDRGTVVARVRSDASGHFTFPELPANEYELRATGPWRLSDQMYLVQIFAGRHYEFGRLELFPSPNYDEPEPAGTPPAAQATPAPHPTELADTGADVAELLAFGCLLVVIGLVLVRRRRWRRNCV